MPNLVHIYCVSGPWHALTLRSRSKGDDVGMHADMTAVVKENVAGADAARG